MRQWAPPPHPGPRGQDGHTAGGVPLQPTHTPPRPRNEGARARTLKLQALFSCFGSGVHHTEGGGRRGRGGTAAAGGKLALLPAPRHGPGALVGGVVGATLVPLHVPDAPNRLDLGVLSAEI